MKERPYIGVTGPTTREEVRHLVRSFEVNRISQETSHLPMVGILVSHKTLNGQEVLNRRYPAFGQVHALLAEASLYTFNTIHYNSREMLDLADQIKGIFMGQIYDEKLCRAIQLNIPWPPIDQVKEVKQFFPDLKIIMQLSHRSLAGKTPIEVAQLLEGYGKSFDYVLIDPSGGRAQIFAPNEVVPYYFSIKEKFPDLIVGFAGGFTGENVLPRCRELIKLVGEKDFSIDAEGGLRNKISEEFGDDLYDAEKVEAYIKAAKEAFL